MRRNLLYMLEFDMNSETIAFQRLQIIARFANVESVRTLYVLRSCLDFLGVFA